MQTSMRADVSHRRNDVLVGVSALELSLSAVVDWAGQPMSRAVSGFAGRVGEPSSNLAELLAYEGAERRIERMLKEVCGHALDMWPQLDRVGLCFRTGRLVPDEERYVVGIASTHKAEAFEALQFCADIVVRTLPSWRHRDINIGRQRPRSVGRFTVESAVQEWLNAK